MKVSADEFARLDIRVGTVIQAEYSQGLRRRAIFLSIDFGPEIGYRKSSARLTDLYHPDWLVGRQVLGVVNLPPRQVGHFLSEVLVLGVDGREGGVALIGPDHRVNDGARIY